MQQVITFDVSKYTFVRSILYVEIGVITSQFTINAISTTAMRINFSCPPKKIKTSLKQIAYLKGKKQYGKSTKTTG